MNGGQVIPVDPVWRRAGPHLVLGRAGLDLYAEPPGASVEEAETFRAGLGGSSANIAVAIRKAGGAAELVTCVSDDAVGRRCLRELQDYGVGTAHVRTEGGEARNSLAIVESRVKGFQSTIYRNGAADFAMGRDDVAALPYADAAALVLTGTVLAAEPSRDAAFAAIERARDAGLPIVFDVDYRPYSWPSVEIAREVLGRAVAGSALVVGNDDEWDWLAGGHPSYADRVGGPTQAGRGLGLAREEAARRLVVYKKGPEGSTTMHDGASFDTPAHPVEALKPIGAGDAFLGTILAAVQAGRPWEEAVDRGAAAAAITVSRFGCAPAIPTPGEIDAFLRERRAEPAHDGPARG